MSSGFLLLPVSHDGSGLTFFVHIRSAATGQAGAGHGLASISCHWISMLHQYLSEANCLDVVRKTTHML